MQVNLCYECPHNLYMIIYYQSFIMMSAENTLLFLLFVYFKLANKYIKTFFQGLQCRRSIIGT